MKIISQPDYTTWTYEFTCYACKSKLRAIILILSMVLPKNGMMTLMGMADTTPMLIVIIYFVQFVGRKLKFSQIKKA